MAVFRINKTKDYTVMSNNHLREKEMSLKAKGLLSLMLSLPEDWDYSISGLITLSKDGKDGVANTLIELERFGYLIRTQKKDENGKFIGYKYDIYETPTADLPCEENPIADKPLMEKHTQINTNKPITDKINNLNIQTDLLTYQEVLKIAQEECPTVYNRYMNKYPMGSSLVFEQMNRILDELSNSYSYERLREVFKKANKMYIIQPKYSKLDLLWLLNNLKKIEEEIVEEQPKKEENNLPNCTVRQVNGTWKL